MDAIHIFNEDWLVSIPPQDLTTPLFYRLFSHYQRHLLLEELLQIKREANPALAETLEATWRRDRLQARVFLIAEEHHPHPHPTTAYIWEEPLRELLQDAANNLQRDPTDITAAKIIWYLQGQLQDLHRDVALAERDGLVRRLRAQEDDLLAIHNQIQILEPEVARLEAEQRRREIAAEIHLRQRREEIELEIQQDLERYERDLEIRREMELQEFEAEMLELHQRELDARQGLQREQFQADLQREYGEFLETRRRVLAPHVAAGLLQLQREDADIAARFEAQFQEFDDLPELPQLEPEPDARQIAIEELLSSANPRGRRAVTVPHDQRECGICTVGMGIDHEAAKLPCGHYFGKECISTWLRTSTTCPFCRRDYSDLLEPAPALQEWELRFGHWEVD